MNQTTGPASWGKNFIVIIALAVMAFAVVTNLPRLFDFFTAEKFSEYRVALESSERIDVKYPFTPQENLNAASVIYLTNKAREGNGLPPLLGNHLLDAIAHARAKDMLEKQYFAHISPTGQQASDLAQEFGYAYKIIAENIGSGHFYTNQKIVDGWMQSPGHRENILSSDVRDMGAAVVKGNMKGKETYVAVQIFGLQSPPVAHNDCVTPSENLIRDIEIKKAEITSLRNQLVRLQDELDADQESIERDKKYTYEDAQRIQKINEKIHVFNEKSLWYNRLVAEAKAKATVMESMVDEYNRKLQDYNQCRNAD